MKTTRDIITIDDLTNEEILNLFKLADSLLIRFKTPDVPYRIGRRPKGFDIGKGCLISTLFYEMSTRTRFSFEAAMQRLGGGVLSFGDPTTTSVGKGESLADTVRVMENYCDLMVLRHPREGAARLAADFSKFSVINAGDGGHEHPTQTLCDLYTLYREKGSIEGLKVLICGDLKNGRTVHSLVYGLARFHAVIATMPGKSLRLPEHVARRLNEEFQCPAIAMDELREQDSSLSRFDAVYHTPYLPHQPALFTSPEKARLERIKQILSKIDACYVTRMQKERMTEESNLSDYPVVDKKFLSQEAYQDASVMHPLPRVDELAYELDKDPRGTYFKQAAYGVTVRMALIASLLRLEGAETVLADARPAPRYEIYPNSSWADCPNPKCISNCEKDGRAVKHRFFMIAPGKDHIEPGEEVLLRCVYCENERMLQPSRSVSTSAKQVETSEEETDSGEYGDLIAKELY